MYSVTYKESRQLFVRSSTVLRKGVVRERDKWSSARACKAEALTDGVLGGDGPLALHGHALRLLAHRVQPDDVELSVRHVRYLSHIQTSHLERFIRVSFLGNEKRISGFSLKGSVERAPQRRSARARAARARPSAARRACGSAARSRPARWPPRPARATSRSRCWTWRAPRSPAAAAADLAQANTSHALFGAERR